MTAISIPTVANYYSPEKKNAQNWGLDSRLITVVGAGALGSQVVMNLAKIGAGQIAVFDDDVIEQHNASNQMFYSREDVGRRKVDVLRDRVELLAGREVANNLTCLRYRVTPESKAAWNWINKSEVLFLCVDSLVARATIVQRLINNAKRRGGLEQQTLVVDGRMGAHSTEAWSFGFTIENAEKYLTTVGNDSDVRVDTGSCGETQNVGATAGVVVGHMMWLYLNALQKPRKEVFESGVQGVTGDFRPWFLSTLTI